MSEKIITINSNILQKENIIKRLSIKSDYNKKEGKENIIDLKPQNNRKEIELKNKVNILIKNALINLKNKKLENDIQNNNNNKEEIKFLGKKKINDKENENVVIFNNLKDNMKDNIKEDKKEDKKENIKKNIEIIGEEQNIRDKDIDDISNIEEEEDEESFSISSNISKNSNNSFNKDQSKIINKYKRRNDKPKIKKKKIFNYQKSNKRTILKRKEYYVNQLLQRWWYALPKWPPENFDIKEKLRENNLRLIEEKKWKKEVEINSDDFKKCIELPGYKYVYITKEGKIYDFRPEKDKPSFNNLMKLDDIKLHQYLVIALKNQLEELEKRNFIIEHNLRINIRNQLKIATLNLAHIKNEKNK